MTQLYVILSVVGWAWCLLVAALLWVRLRRGPEAPATLDPPRGTTDGPAFPAASEGRPEAEA